MIQPIDSATAISNLIHAIEEDRLVILCGAGLSMAAPSCLPSAARLSHRVYDACIAAGETGVTNNIEEQALHFLNAGRFPQYFIGRLIPKDSFSGPPNLGHYTIADFLLCRAVASTVSANVDVLIENAGNNLRGQIDGWLDGVQAATGPADRSPLLKIHGCWTKAPTETVWAPAQRDIEPIKSRIDLSQNWLRLNLVNKELLVIGFWTDWSYLNSVLEVALGAVHPTAVTIIDPCETADLETKAPGLYAIGNQNNVIFRHVKDCGSSFLDELRKEFSRRFFRKTVHLGRAEYAALPGAQPVNNSWFTLPDNIDSNSLYAMRRDIEGREPTDCARNKEPDPQNTLIGLTLLQLQAKGALPVGGYWQLGERKIRVLRTAKMLHNVKEIFSSETPPLGAADIVICVGAEDMGLPTNIAREDTVPNIVRGGPVGNWITMRQAIQELEL